jgi:uncharacterized Tic20 family protein
MRPNIEPARHAQRRSELPALFQLAMTVALVVSIVIAATAVSVGVADAQSMRAMAQPDTSLVLMLMLVAVGLMGALSALAVRIVGRSRPQSE